MSKLFKTIDFPTVFPFGFKIHLKNQSLAALAPTLQALFRHHSATPQWPRDPSGRSRDLNAMWRPRAFWRDANMTCRDLNWLVLLTPLKNMSQWEGLSHILWTTMEKIKNVPNHQPV